MSVVGLIRGDTAVWRHKAVFPNHAEDVTPFMSLVCIAPLHVLFLCCAKALISLY